jgi:hypothetical protein
MTVLLAAAIAGACAKGSQAPTAPETISVPVQIESAQSGGSASISSHKGTAHHQRAHMTGREEVPAKDTKAQGQTNFQVSGEGDAIGYKLIVANIENVLQAHIHLGPAGSNGPIVAWLYPSAPPAQLIPGRSQGVLNEGVITASSLVGPLAAQPLSALLDAMRAGNTYVNVHTSQFPPGEIRGQID